jgi:hypothetical protein
MFPGVGLAHTPCAWHTIHVLKLSLAACLGVFVAACASEDEAPRYDLSSDVIVGPYGDGERCTGDFDACEKVEVRRVGERLQVVIGHYEAKSKRPLVAAARASEDGVVTFTTGELPNEPPWGACMKPGCGNILKVNGVIYPNREGEGWVPRVRVFYTFVFPYPDKEGAPDGELRELRYLSKK